MVPAARRRRRSNGAEQQRAEPRAVGAAPRMRGTRARSSTVSTGSTPVPRSRPCSRPSPRPRMWSTTSFPTNGRTDTRRRWNRRRRIGPPWPRPKHDSPRSPPTHVDGPTMPQLPARSRRGSPTTSQRQRFVRPAPGGGRSTRRMSSMRSTRRARCATRRGSGGSTVRCTELFIGNVENWHPSCDSRTTGAYRYATHRRVTRNNGSGLPPARMRDWCP